MKKRFNVLLVSTVIFGLVLSLFGMTLASQSVSARKAASVDNHAPKVVSATDIHLVKKVPFLPEVGEASAMGETKGNPHGTSLGKDKTKEGAATGLLGSYSGTTTKYAIVIGICNYPGTNHDLCTSDGDSLHMYEALTTLYGYNPDNIYLFKDMGGVTGDFHVGLAPKNYATPTRDAIHDAITTIKNEANSGDEVTFFFSGHGSDGIADDGDNEKRDEAIVVWNNANDVNDNIAYIWDGELRDWFSGFATKRINFVFDSCLAGGMNDVAADGRVISMGTSETSVSYVYSSDLFNLRIEEMKDVDNDKTFDGEGVFTHYFANEGMLRGKADIYNHGIDDGNDATLGEDVVVEEAFDYAKSIIPSTWKRQKPTISDKFTNDLLL